MPLRTELVRVGSHVSYEDMANPRRTGEVVQIDGDQYVVAWDDKSKFPAADGVDPIVGTTSDLRQTGWHLVADMPGNPFDGADIIAVYTRADALADGTLVPVVDLVPDEPDFAEQAGFRCHVALTDAVAGLVIPTARERDECLQDVKGRLWDVLNMARMYKRGVTEDGGTWLFPCIFWLAGPERAAFTRAKRSKEIALKCVLAAGDQGEPTVTIMLRNES